VTGKSRIYTILLLAIAAFAVTGCSVSVGLIGDNLASSNVYGGLLVNPLRLTYNLNEMFQRGDLEVSITNGNDRRSVINECEIRVIHDPSKPSEYALVPPSGGLLLFSGGMKLILVKYQNLTPYQYLIHVVEPSPGENSQSGIIIRWGP
jgi:hypothetical protein